MIGWTCLIWGKECLHQRTCRTICKILSSRSIDALRQPSSESQSISGLLQNTCRYTDAFTGEISKLSGSFSNASNCVIYAALDLRRQISNLCRDFTPSSPSKTTSRTCPPPPPCNTTRKPPLPPTSLSANHHLCPEDNQLTVAAMAIPTNTLLIEGTFEELADELAQYIDSIRKTPAEGATLQSEVSTLLKDGSKKEALQKIVENVSILNSAPEKGAVTVCRFTSHQGPN